MCSHRPIQYVVVALPFTAPVTVTVDLKLALPVTPGMVDSSSKFECCMTLVFELTMALNF